MTTLQIVTLSSLICAAIILIMLISSALFSAKPHNKMYRYFLIMAGGLLFNCLLEIPLLLLIADTEDAGLALMYGCFSFLDYAFASVVRIAYCVYVRELISMKNRVSRNPLRTVLYFEAVHILLIAAGDLGLIPLWLHNLNLGMILPALSIAVSTATALWHSKTLKKRELVSFMLYVIIPVLCYLVEYIYDWIWLASFGGGIALFLIYINIQVELSYRFLDQELELTESRLSVMLSQIQPHFLYNALAAIEDLCDADVGKAKTAVNDFAHYLRGNLESVAEKRMIPFEDELEHVETYLSLEKLRFGDKMRLVFDIQATDFLLPPLTIQPIAENAVRHGIMKKGGTVMIRAERTENAHIITVEDDGAGFDPAEPLSGEKTHVGIANVRERLKALCGGTLTIESIPGIRTQCHITIPFREEDAP